MKRSGLGTAVQTAVAVGGGVIETDTTPPPFPLQPAPSYFSRFRWGGTVDDVLCGVFYEGQTVELGRDKTNSVNYDIYNYYGEVVSSGSTASLTFQPPEPVGGWLMGWYRVLLRGPIFDTDFGYSYGITNFCVLRDDPHFVTMPAAPSGGWESHGGEFPDFVMKGVIGVGTTRMQITDAAAPETGNDRLSYNETNLALTNTYWVDPGAPYADASRPRYAYCQFPNGTVDQLDVPLDPPGGHPYLTVYPFNPAHDPANIFVSTEAGSVSGVKLKVYYPNAGTLVETYDNLASNQTAKTAINGVSAYIWVWPPTDDAASAMTATALPNTKMIGVKNVVSILYAEGCAYFEGPENEEPAGERAAHKMKLFQGYVHDAAAGAKAIGPCLVDLQTPRWTPFLNAGGHNYCDEISFHAYGDTGPGEIDITRTRFQDFLDLLSSYSVSLPLWQTESTSTNTPVGLTHVTQKSSIPILQTLLLEQLGIPKERNNYWYDVSHGFWGIPNWLENGSHSLEPHAVLYRVLAEEIWGKPYDSALDFGTPGNHLYVGNVYVGAAGSTIVIMGQSAMPNGSITLTITGTAGPVTVVDSFGNASTAALASGRVTVTASKGIPVYVELPPGATASVYECNGWGPAGLGASLGATAATYLFDGVSAPLLKDGNYLSDWSSPQVGATALTAPPTTAVLTWSSPQTVNRVIVWCEAGEMLTDFDVETTTNGTVWTTKASVVKSDAVSFKHGCTDDETGTKWETFWDRQWIFDVPLVSVSGVVGVRVSANSATYAGLPDRQSATDNGVSTQGFRLQEIGVY